MRIGYLVNQYPKISHTFVRSEIAGLEGAGTEVVRFSVRPSPDALIDPKDRLEADRTLILLRASAAQALKALGAAMLQPASLGRAISASTAMGIVAGHGFLRHYAYLAEACLLKKWAQDKGVQHIHAHFGTNSAAVAMLCNVIGGPTYSFTVHGPEEFDKAQAISLPMKIRRALFAVAVSDFGRSQLWRYCPESTWNKIHVVRCGVDPAFAALRHEPVPSAPRLVCVGRLCEQKGQILLLRATAELKRSGQDFKLVFVGDGELRGVLESMISGLDLVKQVTITGWQTAEQVRQHIQASRALVLPSFAEGLPVVIMEALAMCRPVISTYVAGIPELVNHAGNGWLTPAGSLSALVEAMREALTASPARLEEMGRAGRARVEENHNSERNALQLNELFSTATANRSH